MPRRIEEDHKDFRDVVSGRIRKELKKFIKTGQIFRQRAKNGKFALTIPRIDIPHIVFGNTGEGIGRGKGKKGQIIKKGNKKGDGPEAGRGSADGIIINIDMETILQFLQEELTLPNLLPKPSNTFEEERKRYNSLSKQGPRSLRHMRKTLQQTMKRHAASGNLGGEKRLLPGYFKPVRVFTLIKDDFRYRQYTIVKRPISNAVVFFARDGSASMDQYKCDIVSDMSWWIDVWIRRFYKRVERCYIWHDWTAQEVDEDKFYKYRFGGGTSCSSAMKLTAKQFENRFPPSKWNIYVFYFTDGENWRDDNAVFSQIIEEQMGPNVVNFVGITQVMAYNYDNSLKKFMDDKVSAGVFSPEYLRTTAIGPDEGYAHSLPPDARDQQIKRAVKELLGAQGSEKKAEK